MLGQATRTAAGFSQAAPLKGSEKRAALGGKARQKLESRLGESLARLLDEGGQERRFAGGEVLTGGGTAGGEIYVVLDGAVGLYHELPPGERDVLGYAFPGDLIAPANPGAAWGFDAKALTRGKLLALNLQELRAPASREVAWLLFEVACGELTRRTARLRGYWFLPVKARLAKFLFEMDEGLGERSERGLVVRLPMFRDEIANYLGTRTETICRILTGWKERGLIVMESPRQLVIPDGARLRADAFARPSESP